ncbi:DNA repair protein RecO [Microgenomates group bacterium RIFCSPLOWO2_01_FULL_46_13]|nr:MAG: DNA repair protein RecO [Microgenomates group bacterium RIFCSPHIGHO2_01_FULL_45_11]OGV94599.1 MAG: DNA repair protein RecO [Microgenomates group bacterium RIFCSPLOWO2_01_FULL_46_13]
MRSFHSVGVVLKRRNFSEADRLVTVFTRKYGKVTVIAKGSRKLLSKKKGGLEPGTVSDFFWVGERGLPIVTQVKIVETFTPARKHLGGVTGMFQMLEIVDLLTPDGQENEEVFLILVDSLRLLTTDGSKRLKLVAKVQRLLKALGFGPPAGLNEQGIKLYLEELAERPLKTKRFLTPHLADSD